MPQYYHNSVFNAGELSEKMLSRPEISQYSKGCRTLENFIVTPYGSVERRPGTLFIANAPDNTHKVRIVPFVYSASISYVLVFSHLTIDIYRVQGNAFVQTLVSPYTEDELEKLQFAQVGDIKWCVSSSHPVQELKRTSATTFTLSEMQWKVPPSLDQNIDDAFKVSASAVTGTVTLTATKSLFKSGHVGSYFVLTHNRVANEISKDFTSSTNSTSLEVMGSWTLDTHGTWSGTLKIQRSFDNGTTWVDYRSYTSSADNNVSTTGEEETEGVLYRLSMTDYSASSTGTLKLCRCLFSNYDFVTQGVVKITAVTNGTTATGTVKKKLGSTLATMDWAEGAFSDVQGYPRTVALYDERLIFGGTASKVQTLWGSVMHDWDNFRLGDMDTDGFMFQLNSDTVNEICWMVPHDSLMIGTMDAEWTINASSENAALTPTNVEAKTRSVFGSSSIQAVKLGSTLLFVQRRGRKVREFVYDFGTDGYQSPDLTVLADHIAAGKIKEIHLQQQPENVLWCVLHDGTLSALTYERAQEVVGWHRHMTNGTLLSMCVVPGEEDAIFWAVKRNGKQMIERMADREFESVHTCVFTDSSVIQANDTAFSEVSGLSHLEGMTVQVLGDGAVMTPCVVTNGVVTLTAPVNRAVVGLGYTSTLEPMPAETQGQDGSTLHRRKGVGEIRIRVADTVGGEVKVNYDNWQRMVSRDVLTDSMDVVIDEKSEICRINPFSGFAESVSLQVRQAEPLPISVCCISMIIDIHE